MWVIFLKESMMQHQRKRFRDCTTKTVTNNNQNNISHDTNETSDCCSGTIVEQKPQHTNEEDKSTNTTSSSKRSCSTSSSVRERKRQRKKQKQQKKKSLDNSNNSDALINDTDKDNDHLKINEINNKRETNIENTNSQVESLVQSASEQSKKKKRKKKKHKSKREEHEQQTIGARNLEHDQKESAITTSATATNSTSSACDVVTSIVDFPYPVDADDHCESPMNAYDDIVPILQKLNSLLHNNNKNRTNYQLHIYDPYYCDGAMKRNLQQLGFSNVYHKKEDCYIIWDGLYTNYPSLIDILVTNPPYSGDHIEKLIHHITSNQSHFQKSNTTSNSSSSVATTTRKAWLLLLPTWVHKKDYYTKALETNHIEPFYIVPQKRYVYIPPTNFRTSTKSDVHKKSSPFTSMWYCYGGSSSINNILIQHFLSYQKSLLTTSKQQITSTSTSSDAKTSKSISTTCTGTYLCDLARSRSALRDLRRKNTKKN